MQEIKVIPRKTYDLIYTCPLEQGDRELCEKIESALGFELFQWQKLYLFYGKRFFGRRMGKTIISCIDVLLKYSIIDCREMRGFVSLEYIKNMRRIESILRAGGLRTGIIIRTSEEERMLLNGKISNIQIPEMATEINLARIVPAKRSEITIRDAIRDGERLPNMIRKITILDVNDM